MTEIPAVSGFLVLCRCRTAWYFHAFIAHCPASNMIIASGIAPVRRYLELGIHVGLAGDVAAGESESIFRAVACAVQVSKLYWRLVDQICRQLSFAESFYLATAGGGEFFGKVGSFDEGYEFYAVVLPDEHSHR